MTAGICVVTPSFAQGRFIERTIRSVLDQGIADLDYVVVDGGSRDDTVGILTRYQDRLRFVSEPDDGQADAVNKALAMTTAPVIGWINSDDVYYPGALATVLAFFESHPEVDVVYGEARHIDEHDGFIEDYYTDSWDFERLLKICFICQPALFFRRRVIERFGALDAGLRYCMDYEYWIRLAQGGAVFAHLPQVLAGSRLYAETKTLGARVKVHAEINDMLHRRLGRVPNSWIVNYAHALIDDRGIARDDRPRYTYAVTWAMLTAGLRWNRWPGRALLTTVLKSLVYALGDQLRCRQGAPPEPPAGPGPGADRETTAQPDRYPAPLPETYAMKIGFDVSQTGADKAGCGMAADNLIRQLPALLPEAGFMLYPTFGDLYWDDRWDQDTYQPTQANTYRGFHHTSHEAARDFWRQPPADLDRVLGTPDLVHANNFFCPTGLTRARLVYTLYDLNFLEHPGWSEEANRIGCFTGVFNAALHADLVIAISEFSRRHFLATFPHYPADRTAVAHLASRFGDAGTPGHQPPTPRLAGLARGGYWLAVGTIEPRKNYDGLARAYARLRADLPSTPDLVIVGKPGWLMQHFPALLAELGIADHVHLLGYADEQELSWLYHHSFAVVYPTFWEGFGLPVIEALTHGVPVISSDVSSIPEVLGDAGLLIDPHDITTLVAAMRTLATTPGLRDQLALKARRQASQFSWEATGRRVAELYREVLARPKYAGA